jgi:polysaccharide biosynthesis transport protein
MPATSSYRILKREADTNRTLYDGLLQRYKEIGVAGGVGTNNVSIVDRAQLPGAPVKPDLSRNLMLAVGVGLFLGAFAAVGLEFFDDSLKLAEEVETALGLPVLGIIPLVQSEEATREAVDHPRSSLAEAFRSLRTALQFSTETGAPRSLVVTSSRPGEGKSTVALALARNFADIGLKVLLVDADLRDPSLHRELGLANDRGLTNYLAGTAMPPELFQPTAMESLTFLPTGPLPPNPAELLAGPKMPSLLQVRGALRHCHRRCAPGDGPCRRAAPGQRRQRHPTGAVGQRDAQGCSARDAQAAQLGPRPGDRRRAQQVRSPQGRVHLWLWLRLRL